MIRLRLGLSSACTSTSARLSRVSPLRHVRVLSSLHKSNHDSNQRSRISDPISQAQKELCKESGWKKRKVALVFGFIGKDYKGLQMIDPTIPTIEREVEGALFKLGCILPTNRQDLEKIGWSRSSRTDKGAHQLIYVSFYQFWALNQLMYDIYTFVCNVFIENLFL